MTLWAGKSGKEDSNTTEKRLERVSTVLPGIITSK